MTKKTSAHCEVMLERLSAYLDEDLAASVCHDIERHAAGCPRCSVVLRDLKKTVGLCHRAAAAPLPAAIRRRARARVRQIMRDRTS